MGNETFYGDGLTETRSKESNEDLPKNVLVMQTSWEMNSKFGQEDSNASFPLTSFARKTTELQRTLMNKIA